MTIPDFKLYYKAIVKKKKKMDGMVGEQIC